MAGLTRLAAVFPKPRSIVETCAAEAPAKAEPEHSHFDFRFVFRAIDRREIGVTLQWEEVRGYRWLALSDVSSPSVAAKLTLLLSDGL
ncbi:hypothetical protein ACOZ38_26115 [Sphaerisporangium viridialbum]|uniref:hypothetical protein n=1 Tax=Sphaerisporangium viridialbum TaxID=46189 RepID=UPI003C77C515